MGLIKGIYPAMVSPMDASTGAVDDGVVRDLLDFLVEQGVHGVFPAGTAGEGVLLTRSERQHLLAVVCRHVDGKIPVLAHTGAITAEDTILLTRFAEEEGAAAVSIVTPFYYPYSDEELLGYYTSILENTERIPIYFYNIPSHAGNSISLEVVRKLSQSERIAGIKDSSGDQAYLDGLLQLQSEEFDVMVGMDPLVHRGLSGGAVGAVSSFAGVFPEPYLELYRCHQEGRPEEAVAIQERIVDLCSLLQFGAPLSIYKECLTMRGIPAGIARPPIGRITDLRRRETKEALRSRGFLN